MAQHPCPICGRPVDTETTPAMPFCSLRCRQIDLARWLGERYLIPGEIHPSEELSPDPSSPAVTPPSQEEENDELL